MHLLRLQGPITMEPKINFFTPKEVEGLDKSLVCMLDVARGYAGVPFKITSGKRTYAENQRIGGAPNSSHLKGLAVDIAVPNDPQLRAKICWALGYAGFPRVFTYTCHIHADIDREKVHPIMKYMGESH